MKPNFYPIIACSQRPSSFLSSDSDDHVQSREPRKLDIVETARHQEMSCTAAFHPTHEPTPPNFEAVVSGFALTTTPHALYWSFGDGCCECREG
ncbi:hypothetical protein Hte_004962 [Hypoxylon texense]